MANQGKRMVKENLIAQIGQGGGGGSEYTAGNGINITEDVISVDTNTIATKAELGSFAESFGGELNNILNTGTSVVQRAKNDENGNEIDTTYATKAELNTVAARTATLYSYMQRPIDVYNELVAKEPSTTNQDAVNEWLKRMPTFISTNINATGLVTLQNMGFKNIIQIQPGAEYDIQGYFSIIFEGVTNTEPYAMQTCMADRVGNNKTNLWNKAVGTRVQHTIVIGSTQIEFQNCRFREANNTMQSYTNLFNNNIGFVQQMGVNAQTDAMLGMSNDMVSHMGREAESIAISVQGGIMDNNQFNTQLKAPTADGTYVLKVTVANGVPTFAWVLEA